MATEFPLKEWQDLPNESTPIDRETLRDAEKRLAEYTDSKVGSTTGQPWTNVKSAPYNAKGDGTGDDTAAFVAALADIGTATRGVLYVPPGDYPVKGATGIFKGISNLIVMGAGRNVVTIKCTGTTGSNIVLFKLENISNVIIDGITFDGQDQAQLARIVQGIKVKSMTVRRCGFKNQTIGYGLESYEGEKTTFEKNEGNELRAFINVENPVDEAIIINENRCYSPVHERTAYGISVNSSNRKIVGARITKNTVRDCMVDVSTFGIEGHGIQMYNCEDNIVEANHVSNCLNSGIHPGAGSNGSEVSGNTCTENHNICIYAECNFGDTTTGTAGEVRGIHIEGNTCNHSTGDGIVASYAAGSVIEGNICHDNTNEGIACDGDDVIFSNNIIFNNNKTKREPNPTPVTFEGVGIVGGIRYWGKRGRFDGNIIFDNQNVVSIERRSPERISAKEANEVTCEAFTPSVNQILIAVVGYKPAEGDTITADPVVTSSPALTWTKIEVQDGRTSGQKGGVAAYWAKASSEVAHKVTAKKPTGDSATGVGLKVMMVKGANTTTPIVQAGRGTNEGKLISQTFESKIKEGLGVLSMVDYGNNTPPEPDANDVFISAEQWGLTEETMVASHGSDKNTQLVTMAFSTFSGVSKNNWIWFEIKPATETGRTQEFAFAVNDSAHSFGYNRTFGNVRGKRPTGLLTIKDDATLDGEGKLSITTIPTTALPTGHTNQVVSYAWHNAWPVKTYEQTEANLSSYILCEIPATGKLTKIWVYNGATAAGNVRVAVLDTGQAVTGKYTVLSESATTAMTGTNVWQAITIPTLAVSAGQMVMLGVVNSGTGAFFGRGEAFVNIAAVSLPEGTVTGVTVKAPKLTGIRKLAGFAFEALTEANMEATGAIAPALFSKVE